MIRVWLEKDETRAIAGTEPSFIANMKIVNILPRTKGLIDGQPIIQNGEVCMLQCIHQGYESILNDRGKRCLLIFNGKRFKELPIGGASR